MNKLNTKSLMVAYTQALADNYLVATYVQSGKCKGLPSYFEDQIRLDLGLNTPIPILDLRVDEEGISGSLSFNRKSHFVEIPWHAVDGFLSSEEADRLVKEGQEKHQKAAMQENQQQSAPPQAVGKVFAREDNVLRVRFGKL